MQVNETFSSYIMSMNNDQLKDYIKGVGKAANERLRALERSGLENSSAAYRYIKKMSRDADSAMGFTRKGQMKFNVSTRAVSTEELRHRAALIDNFMDAKSSTVGGTKDIYRQSFETFKKNHPDAKISFDEFAGGMSYGLLEHFYHIYGSELTVELYEKATGLTNREIEQCLLEGGFTLAATKDDAPYVDTLFSQVESYQEYKRSMSNESVAGFDDDSML